MATLTTLCKMLIGVKDIVVNKRETYLYTDDDGVVHFHIAARPSRRSDYRCPICGRKCPGYDHRLEHKTWRGLDLGSVLVEIEACTHRICCPEHGVVTASVPWAYPGSRFTKAFDLTVAWLATHLSRSAVSEFMRIDWATVGRCITRALKDLEPERSRRLDGLVNIGIDETSYRKGHKYITVVVNHDTNTVVWVHDGHGKAVLEQFYEELTPEQRASIRVVTGDGANWITDCVNKYTPDCERCVDPFHVVEWAMAAVDKVRVAAWREAQSKVRKLEEARDAKPGRPKKNDAEMSAISSAREDAKAIKNSAYALGKAPENLTAGQRLKLQIIAVSNPRLNRAYQRKEELRLLLKNEDSDVAAEELKRWYWKASHSRIEEINDLARKIKRHKEHILNAIRYKMSNARIEATNNKIKLIIRKAYGFRNIYNMIDMVYLVCSRIKVPLPNRKPKSHQLSLALG